MYLVILNVDDIVITSDDETWIRRLKEHFSQ